MRATRDVLNKTIHRRYLEADSPKWLNEKMGWSESYTFRFQSLTDTERSYRESWHQDKEGNNIPGRRLQLKASWIAASFVDDDGNRQYTDEDIETKVSQMDSALTNWLVDRVFDHLGISLSDAEELEKNLSETVDEDYSPTVSLGECVA